MIKKLMIKLNCLIGNHELTCKADERIKPPDYIKNLKTKESIIAAFNEYAKVYCKHCKRIL